MLIDSMRQRRRPNTFEMKLAMRVLGMEADPALDDGASDWPTVYRPAGQTGEEAGHA